MSKKTVTDLMPSLKLPSTSLSGSVTFWKEIAEQPIRICKFRFGGIRCRTAFRPSKPNQIHCPYHNRDHVVRFKYLMTKYPDLKFIKEKQDTMGKPRPDSTSKMKKVTTPATTPAAIIPATTEPEPQPMENLTVKSSPDQLPPPTLNQIQDEIHNWSIRNFGPVPNDSFDYEMICTILMIAEAFGRCCHAALKSAQDIRGDKGSHRQEYFRGINEIKQAVNSGTVLQARDFYRIITKNGYRLSSLIGMWEESAEMLRAMYDGNDLEVSDAIGDMMVFFADFCGRNSRSLEDKFVETWDKVKKRDWQKNKLTGQVD